MAGQHNRRNLINEVVKRGVLTNEIDEEVEKKNIYIFKNSMKWIGEKYFNNKLWEWTWGTLHWNGRWIFTCILDKSALQGFS